MGARCAVCNAVRFPSLVSQHYVTPLPLTALPLWRSLIELLCGVALKALSAAMLGLHLQHG